MKKNKKHFYHIKETIFFSIVTFFIMFFAFGLVFCILLLFRHFNLTPVTDTPPTPLFHFGFVSVIVGTILSLFFSHRPMKPIYDIMDGIDKIADGDYSIRIPPAKHQTFAQLDEKFNHMAEELGSVEIMRNDFVNNFSHEFKTPIVSIRGFAKMLKRENLTPEERNEYLDIIINESERLADLATNVLNLSKIEQQSIVTNKKEINISEQIRLAIALLDNKLFEKNLNIIFDCKEYYFYGNEEMLKQVWINLLDNAIKFTPEHGNIEITISQEKEQLKISFKNDTNNFTDETMSHIFDKFYQGDSSHTTKGNGLGLTLVKRIVELHNGNIIVNNTISNAVVFEIFI